MRNLYRLKTNEQKIADIIAKGIVIILAVIFYIFRFIFKTLYKFKKWLYRIAILILIANGVIPVLTNIVYAPKPIYAEYAKPTSEREQIINYIIKTFGKYSNDAIAIANCESHLNPRALNNNESWGGVGKDYGVFQINNKYQKITNIDFLYDYKVNINIAWNIFQNRGYNWSAWSCAKYLGL